MGTFDKLIQEIWENSDEFDNAAVGYEYKGEPSYIPYNYCHASLKRVPEMSTLVASSTQRKSKGYTTSIGYGGWVGDELALRYYDWLINKSPYARPMLTKDPEYVICKGIVSDTKHPSNLIAGGFIAQRYAWENPEIVRSMFRYNEWGLSLNMSFVLAHVIHLKDDTIKKLRLSDHVAITSSDVSPFYCRNFIRGTLKNINKTLYEDVHYGVISRMWGDVEEDSFYDKLESHVRARVKDDNPFKKVFHKEDDRLVKVRKSFGEDVFKFCKEVVGRGAVL